MASTSTGNLLPLPLAMASSSTSTAVNAPANSCYEIFLNHRGPDAKNTFASYLYRRLVLHGFRVFWDKEEMQVGDTLTSQIQDAIKTASVHVAIFSPRYAESKWCLDELHLMVESGKPIIPVFYHIQPGELKRTEGRGIYAEALCNLQKKRRDHSQPRYSSTTIRNWKTALSTVAGISGLELDEFNGDEGELLDKVVDSVSQKLRKARFDVAEHPTGLDEKIKDFENKVLLVQQKGEPQVMGIVGLGGIGKTTLVQELFNRKNSNYHRSCFLSDVRENPGKISLPSLQRKLLKGLTETDQQIESVNEGIVLLKTHLSSYQALVILDDVEKYLKACDGLPLSLKVFGALLFGKDISFWEDQLDRLEQILPDEIQKRLQISYYALQMDEKQIFLDIACFFIGEKRDTAVRIWDGSGWKGSLGFQSLQNKSLVEVNHENEIRMHDHLRDLGRDFANDRGLPRRLWRWMQIDDFFQQSSVLTEVRGISMRLSKYQVNVSFSRDKLDKLRKMRKLQLLQVDMDNLYLDNGDDLLKNILNVVHSASLLWLSCDNCLYYSLPSWIPMMNLRVLKVGGQNLETLWQEESQVNRYLSRLKVTLLIFFYNIAPRLLP